MRKVGYSHTVSEWRLKIRTQRFFSNMSPTKADVLYLKATELQVLQLWGDSREEMSRMELKLGHGLP